MDSVRRRRARWWNGLLTVLTTVHSARDVSKSTHSGGEFGRTTGVLILDSEVVCYRAPVRKHTTGTAFDVEGRDGMPRVEIVYSYAGADGSIVDAVRQMRPDGLVVAGFGGGTYPPEFIAAAARAVEDGIPVVLASRSTAGRVVMTPGNDGSGHSIDNSAAERRVSAEMALTGAESGVAAAGVSGVLAKSGLYRACIIPRIDNRSPQKGRTTASGTSNSGR